MFSFIDESFANVNITNESKLKETKEEQEKKRNFHNNNGFNDSFNYVTNYLKIEETKINFEYLFNRLVKFILKHNQKQFKPKQNNADFKYFLHVNGGASIKYNGEKYGLNLCDITSDIDVNIYPLEKIPNTRINIVNSLIKSLKQEYPKYYISVMYQKNAVSILINGIKTLDIVIDNYKKNSNFSEFMKRYYKNPDVKTYFENLVKNYTDNPSSDNLVKLTFTTLDLEHDNTLRLIDYNQNKIKESSDIEKINELKLKIIRYNKKLEYIKQAITNRSNLINK